MTRRYRAFRPQFFVATIGILGLSGCSEPFDLDMRGLSGGFSTAKAAQQSAGARPKPDARGVLSYPSYQVAIARRGETVADMAARLGTDATKLATYNGIETDVPLRAGEIIALPDRAGAAPAPTTGAAPARVDVTTLAGKAIDNAAATPVKQPTKEPVRHKVQRGETAYSVARRYGVSVRALARWNGLDGQYHIREGQYLLIPVEGLAPPVSDSSPTAPGEGSPTPQPPSAREPLPKEAPPPPRDTSDKPVADLGKQTKPADAGRFARPVTGTVIREYAKGRNDGINIKAAPGSPVKAAGNGTVAAITESAEGVPIVVIRHKDNLLTVYANVTDVSVKKGDPVRRGQSIAKLRSGDQSFVHFEVRQGFDSVDPNDFLG